MKKKILFSFIVLFLLLFVTGCTDKTAITAVNFQDKMEKKGYTIYDVTDQYSSYGYIVKVLIAMNEDNSYQLEFYSIDNEEHAKSVFNTNKTTFEEIQENSSSKAYSYVSVGNHSKYTLSAEGRFMAVSRIDDTIIYLDVDKEYTKEVKSILKELGY